MSADAIVIGGGASGLTAALVLARGGKRVVVCERRERLGGVRTTEEFHPGFRANMCLDDAGWIPAPLAQELGLAALGYSPALAGTGLVIPLDGATPLVLPTDVGRASEAIRRLSAADAARWPEFCAFVARLAGFLEALYSLRPPDIHTTSPRDLLTMLSLGGRLRRLGKQGMIDLLRTVPMPVAELLDEWFEHPALKAALALQGVINVQHGPMSGGTALVLLHRHVGLPVGHIGGRRITPGGVMALTEALAKGAAAAGVTIRTSTVVREVIIENDAVVGVRLDSGDVLRATTVLSAIDPRLTFDSLADPGYFDPELLNAVDHIRMRGPAARVHLALSGAPDFSTAGVPWPAEATQGTIAIAGSVPRVERAYDAAKHGRLSEDPVLLVTVPSLRDPSLAPAGGQVMSVQVQFTPYHLKGGWSDAARRALGERVLELVRAHVPALPQQAQHMVVLAPPDLEVRYGVAEGSLMHGELALDQFLFMRPVPPCARYRSTLDGLWLCGSGSHPGAGTAGASGWLAAREVLAGKA